jgi:outer membrane biosynthesis protein TonB
MDAVTEVLIDRTHDVDRLSRMMVVSFVAHAALIAVVAIVPQFVSGTARDEGPVMTISLAGGEGPIQGRNPESAKPIQEAVSETAKPKNDAPPAIAKPEMIEPVAAKKPEPKTPAKPEPKKEEPQLHGRTPTQGAEVRQGTARTETGQTAAVQFGGLATGGVGDGARTEFGDFCCPEYLVTIQRLIYANTNHQQGQAGTIVMKFVIQRDGTITDVTAPQEGNQFLELASRRALAQTQKLPPLPSQYSGSRLTVLIDFKYR